MSNEGKTYTQMNSLAYIVFFWLSCMGLGILQGRDRFLLLESSHDQSSEACEATRLQAMQLGFQPIDELNESFIKQLQLAGKENEKTDLWIYIEGPRSTRVLEDWLDLFDGMDHLRVWLHAELQAADESQLNSFYGDRDNVLLTVWNSAPGMKSEASWIKSFMNVLAERKKSGRPIQLRKQIFELATTYQDLKKAGDASELIVFSLGYKDEQAGDFISWSAAPIQIMEANTLVVDEQPLVESNIALKEEHHAIETAQVAAPPETLLSPSEVSAPNKDQEPVPEEKGAVTEIEKAKIAEMTIQAVVSSEPTVTDEMVSWDPSIALKSSSTYKTYPYAAKRNVIKEIQRRLRDQGYYKSSIDGVPGPSFHSALQQFQIAQNLTPHSLLDDKTITMLQTKAGMQLVSRAVPKTYYVAKKASVPAKSKSYTKKKTYSSYKPKKKTYAKTYTRTYTKKPTYKKPTTRSTSSSKSTKPAVRVLPYLE